MSQDNRVKTLSELEIFEPTATTMTGVSLQMDTRAGGTSSVARLADSDTLLNAVTKLSALEALLALTVKDCKFDEFMREILLAILGAVKSEAGSLLELDYRRQAFFFRAVVGQSAERVKNFVVPMGHGVVGHVAESRQPLIVNDVEENKMHLKAIEKIVGFETRNMIALPIMIRGKVFAVLELLNRVGDRNYTPADVELLQYLAGFAAKIMEARLTLNWALRSQTRDEAA